MTNRIGGWAVAVLVVAALAVAAAQSGAGFTEGQEVVAVVDLNVRAGPGADNASVGVQLAGARAVVISSSPANAGGLNWWRLRWEDGLVGWSAEGNSSQRFLALAVTGGTGQASDLFLDRFWRVFGGFLAPPGPRFDGPIESVTRTELKGDRVTQQTTWRFDAHGRPSEVDHVFYVDGVAYSRSNQVTYGADNLPVRIEGRTGDELEEVLFRWGPNSVEAWSTAEFGFQATYSYAAAHDSMTIEEDTVLPLRTTVAFHADGSSTSRALTLLDGTWTEVNAVTSDAHNVTTYSEGLLATNETSVTARDARGNPTRASMVSRGFAPSTGSITWDITYRSEATAELPAPAAGFERYHNARFGYAVDYPLAHFAPGPEPENRDGLVFLSSDGRASLHVVGSHGAFYGNQVHYGSEIDVEAFYAARVAELPGVTYQTVSPSEGWFVISGYDGDTIYYEKRFANERCSNVSLELRYPVAQRETYDALTSDISRSFVCLGGGI